MKSRTSLVKVVAGPIRLRQAEREIKKVIFNEIIAHDCHELIWLATSPGWWLDPLVCAQRFGAGLAELPAK